MNIIGKACANLQQLSTIEKEERVTILISNEVEFKVKVKVKIFLKYT